jgi:hypothetical protein
MLGHSGCFGTAMEIRLSVRRLSHHPLYGGILSPHGASNQYKWRQFHKSIPAIKPRSLETKQ